MYIFMYIHANCIIIASYHANNYGTNHSQLKRHTRVCRVCKSKKHAWHQTTRVHACKMNAPHTRT